MTKTIMNAYTISGYFLPAASQGVWNPVTVTGSIDLGNATETGALFGQGPGVWSITNLGTITGDAVAGIYLAAGGTVSNGGGGTTGFVSGHYGVRIANGTGGVTNSATITASGTGTAAAATVAIGVWLTDGGAVTNQTTGRINGQGWGVAIQGAAGTVTNNGIIGGVARNGVYLNTGAVTNQSQGAISGTYGIVIKTGGSVSNAGSVSGGTSSFQSGIYLSGGGVTNQSGGVISGNYGVLIETAGSVTNAGTITGASKSGVFLHSGMLTNQGTVTGVWGVVIQGGTGSVVNSGVLNGTAESGAYLTGGTLTNLSGGLIEGVSGVVIKTAPGTVVNAGQIDAAANSNYAVYTAPGFVNRVIVDPGAVFNALVSGGNTAGSSIVSTLELAASSLLGTISGLGSTFIDFGVVTVDPGASWSVTGVNSLATGVTLLNQGMMTLNGAVLADAAAATISSTISAAAGLTVTGTGAFWNESAPLVVGSTGAGSMLVSNDGSARVLATPALAALTLGGGSGSEGALEVTGPGSELSAVGQLTVGQAGAGAVRIDDQGVVTAGGDAGAPSQGVDLGQAPGGSGEIVVTGTNSSLTNTGAFVVGDAGLGSLAIADGASVTTTPGAVAGLAGLVIANTTSASGSSVNVSGAGSDLTVTGTLIVGDAGAGGLSLAQGASATAGALAVGAGTTGDGVVSVSGTGTTLDVTGALTLGAQSAGELSVLAGAGLTIGGGVVGSSKTAPGNLDVEGAGSLLTINGGTLTVGANGPAEFTLGIGATLSGEVANGQFGVVSEYGNVDPATDPNDGTQNVGFGNSLIYDYYVANSGTIKITSGTATFYTPLVTDETNAADSSTSGLWVIGAHETLVMNATSVDATQVFDLTSASAATLVIGQVPQASTTQTDTFNGQTMPALTGSVAPGAANVLPGWDAPIENFASGDLIVLRGLSYGSATSSGDVVTVWSGAPNTSSALGSLTFLTKSGAASSAEAALAATQINSLACFAAGTRIATPDGWVKVEDLRVGDRVRTIEARPPLSPRGPRAPSSPDRRSSSSSGLSGGPDAGAVRFPPSSPGLSGGPDAASVVDQVPRTSRGMTRGGGRGMTGGGGRGTTGGGGHGTTGGGGHGTTGGGGRGMSEGNDRGITTCDDRGVTAEPHADAPQVASEPIVWLGSRTVDCAKHPHPETVWPVRVSAGAFGANCPVRDLYLSPDHAIFVNDVLIPVKLLINGTTITQRQRTRVTYYHVELPEHAVILAEGLPVESYLDTGDRANFTGAETIRLFPDFAARLAPDAARLWETKGVAPLVTAGAALASARMAVTGIAPPPRRTTAMLGC